MNTRNFHRHIKAHKSRKYSVHFRVHRVGTRKFVKFRSRPPYFRLGVMTSKSPPPAGHTSAIAKGDGSFPFLSIVKWYASSLSARKFSPRGQWWWTRVGVFWIDFDCRYVENLILCISYVVMIMMEFVRSYDLF